MFFDPSWRRHDDAMRGVLGTPFAVVFARKRSRDPVDVDLDRRSLRVEYCPQYQEGQKRHNITLTVTTEGFPHHGNTLPCPPRMATTHSRPRRSPALCRQGCERYSHSLPWSWMGRGGEAREGGGATEVPAVTGVCTCAFTSPNVAPSTHTHPNPTRRPPTPHPPRTHGQAQEAASRGDQPRNLLDFGHEDIHALRPFDGQNRRSDDRRPKIFGRHGATVAP